MLDVLLQVTSDASTRPGAIVRSPRGQLATTQPPGALAQRPSSAADYSYART